MAELNNLEELFEHMLQDMYYAEKQIKETLPEMAEKSSDRDLRSGFEQHLEETKDQIGKLEKVFELCGLEANTEECESIEGLLEEGEDLIEKTQEGPIRDSALIAAGQKVEHYEIASYGTLAAIAEKLGQQEAADLLHEILEQEKATDEKLNKLAGGIEEAAMQKAA